MNSFLYLLVVLQHYTTLRIMSNASPTARCASSCPTPENTAVIVKQPAAICMARSVTGTLASSAPPEAVRFCSHVFIAPVFNPFKRYRIFAKRRGEAAALIVAKQLDHFLHNVDAMRDYSHEAKKNLCERFHAHPDESIMVFYA